jgi:hypothetical protein
MSEAGLRDQAERCLMALGVANPESSAFESWTTRLHDVCRPEPVELPAPPAMSDQGAARNGLRRAQTLIGELDPRTAAPRRVLGIRVGGFDGYFHRYVERQEGLARVLADLDEIAADLPDDPSSTADAPVDEATTLLHEQSLMLDEVCAQVSASVEQFRAEQPDRSAALNARVLDPLLVTRAGLADRLEEAAEIARRQAQMGEQSRRLGAGVRGVTGGIRALVGTAVAASGVAARRIALDRVPGLVVPVSPVGRDEREVLEAVTRRYDTVMRDLQQALVLAGG